MASTITDILHMDTDDLSKEAYDAVIIEAEKLTHDLTLHFGVLSSSCTDESEYLDKSKQLAERVLQLDDYELEDFLFGNVPDKDRLDTTLKRIISNIEEVNKFPMGKRHYDF